MYSVGLRLVDLRSYLYDRTVYSVPPELQFTGSLFKQKELTWTQKNMPTASKAAIQRLTKEMKSLIKVLLAINHLTTAPRAPRLHKHGAQRTQPHPACSLTQLNRTHGGLGTQSVVRKPRHDGAIGSVPLAFNDAHTCSCSRLARSRFRCYFHSHAPLHIISVTSRCCSCSPTRVCSPTHASTLERFHHLSGP